MLGEFRKRAEFLSFFTFDTIRSMRHIFTLFLHEIVAIVRLGQPGGLRSVVAKSVLMRRQLLIVNRGRKRAPNLQASDRIIAGLCSLLMRPIRVLRSAVVWKPATLLHFHQMLLKQKYRLLFSLKQVCRPGPKGPTKALIDAVVEMKRGNRTWGYKRIARQIALAFGVDIDKDVVRRILIIHFYPEGGSGGPSWLSFIGHAEDSLWSLDLFRCESAQTPTLPGLFQSVTCAPGLTRTATRSGRRDHAIKLRFISVAATPSGAAA